MLGRRARRDGVIEPDARSRESTSRQVLERAWVSAVSASTARSRCADGEELTHDA
jgi:hypothetical protein